MRKFLTILLITLLFVSSCSKREDIQPTILSPDSPCFAEVDDNFIMPSVEKPALFELGDGKYDAAGHGADVTIDIATLESVRFPVIDINRLVADYPDYVRKEYLDGYQEYYYSNYSSNAYEYLDKMSKQQKATYNTPVFTKHFDTFLGLYTKYYDSFNAGYVCASYEMVVPKKTIVITAPMSVLINYITSYFLDYINTQTTEHLVRTFGTHVMTSIYVGGKLNLLYISQTFNPDREYAAKVGMKLFTENVIGIVPPEDINMGSLSKNYHSYRTYWYAGGKIHPILVGGKLYVEDWKNSITVESSLLCDLYGDNALIPIYEFIADPAKKAEVKAYVEQYIRDKIAKLDYVAEYLYNFYSNEYECNYYNMCSSVPENYISMGPYYTGKVFSYKALGTVPVYYFYKSENGKADHYYSTNPTTPQGYVMKGIYFYAYPTQKPGTVPVYQYLDKARNSHYYSTQNNKDSQGVAWYAFPSE